MSDRSIMKERVDKALEIAGDHGQGIGEQHKMWTIDQIVRALLGSDSAYEAWVDMQCDRRTKNGIDYSWNTGEFS